MKEVVEFTTSLVFTDNFQLLLWLLNGGCINIQLVNSAPSGLSPVLFELSDQAG